MVCRMTNTHGMLARRHFLGGAVAGAAVVATTSREASAGIDKNRSWAAAPPAGFTPFNAPGKVVRVTKPDCLQANKNYPKPEDARAMLEKALTSLTGKPNLVEAVRVFVSPADKVCVKVNGIALKNMSTNKELVLPFIQAMIDSGVPAANITVLEQWMGFLQGTRINAQNVPPGVKIAIHGNKDTAMEERHVEGTRTGKTTFARALTDSTAVINFALIKDHSITGYTGAIKNMTHGCSLNPHDFHQRKGSPQLAHLYNQDVIRSRVRLNIADGFKIMAHGGPLYKKPEYVKAHDSVYVSTDPVAMDVIGWEMVEKARAEFKLKTLESEDRAPTYMKVAEGLGLGVAERSKIQFFEVAI